MGQVVEIRDAVYDAISTRKTASGFLFNNFTLEKAYMPERNLEDLKLLSGGLVYIVGSPFSESILSRANARRREIPVKVGYQKFVEDTTDITALDLLVNFCEELCEVCVETVSHSTLAWLRNDRLEDPNGVPYRYEKLRSANVFEYYFDAIYWNPVGA